MSLTSQLDIRIQGALVSALDLVSRYAPFDLSFSKALASGTGLDAADVIFSDTRTTATNEDLDLAGGGLTDHLGNAFAPAKLKLLFVSAPAANPGNIVITRPAANGVPIFAAASDAHAVVPGGCFLLFSPAAAGICSVTAATGDLINFASSSGSSTYSIVIIGTSA